ncbi:SDR family NAD(P)-dependent oxidoreductase [Nocardioides terrisoli]|uniref:SDR family NAD(P)-dependent oxidoreductase n=1 Tax=Nocardioides terrisoli TaxID=3388267 RepID=UPI00287B7C3C|nr:glucose 1-dehydrogenase [Nocardioides marmorisolisilvae]
MAEVRIDPGGLFSLAGKTVLVTGGSRGLGREMCLGFAAAGADVVVSSRDLGACEMVAAEVEALGRRAVPVACHVGRWDELTNLADAAMKASGRVDVLVNNAGMSPVYGSVAEIGEDLWDKTVNVNMRAAFRLTALLAPKMVAAGGGAVVNVSSIGAVRPTRDIVPYAAAKAGLNAMTAALAKEYSPSVRVNAIMPGAFATDVAEYWSDEAVERVCGMTALGRVGRPKEIVGTALYLASDASSFTNGAVIAVDGGRD